MKFFSSVQLSKTFTEHHRCLLSKTSGLHASSMQIKSQDLSVFILFSETLWNSLHNFCLYFFFSRFYLSEFRRCKARWSQLAWSNQVMVGQRLLLGIARVSDRVHVDMSMIKIILCVF